MPYLNTFVTENYWAGLVCVPVTFTLSTATVVSGLKAPPLVSAAKANTGVVTVTFSDGPYYQCVGAVANIVEGTPTTAGLVAKATKPTDASGTTSTVTIYTGADQATAVNPGSASEVTVLYFFRKISVP